MLNSYSGAGIGFTSATLRSSSPALVGSSGDPSYIGARDEPPFISVILGGFGGGRPRGGAEQRSVKLGSAEDAAFIMKNASKVIVVPGYGTACASPARTSRDGGQAQGRGRGSTPSTWLPAACRPHERAAHSQRAPTRVRAEDQRRVQPADVAFATPTMSRTLRRRRTSPPIYGMPVAGLEGGTVIPSSGRLRRATPASTTRLLPRQHHDAVRRQEGHGRHRQGALTASRRRPLGFSASPGVLPPRKREVSKRSRSVGLL